MWDENTLPGPNLNGGTVHVWKWISNFIPHLTGHMITYPSTDGFVSSGYSTGQHCAPCIVHIMMNHWHPNVPPRRSTFVMFCTHFTVSEVSTTNPKIGCDYVLRMLPNGSLKILHVQKLTRGNLCSKRIKYTKLLITWTNIRSPFY